MDWRWPEFLGRSGGTIDEAAARAAVEGRRVLITGAGGSIGSRLAEAALLGDVQRLIVLDSSEYSLYEALRTLTRDTMGGAEIVPVLGDILDLGMLDRVLCEHRPDLVFHAAAYKHVTLLERNPFAAIRNNALGTFYLAVKLGEHEGCDLILLSTDKAVEPISIMGASKRIAELAVLAHHDEGSMRSVLRLPNVLGSSGSVVPLFAEQLEQGAALAVTHPEVRRFFLGSQEAAEAMLRAATVRRSGRVLVPEEAPALAILDLARHMSGRHKAEHPEQSMDAGEAEIKIIGLRPGEKMVERLTSSSETLEEVVLGGLRVFRSPFPELTELCSLIVGLEHAVRTLSETDLYAAIQALVPEYAASSGPAEPDATGVTVATAASS